jgi:hypothetical protein
MRLACLAAASVLVGCPKPDPAPEDLDALVRFGFAHYGDEGGDARRTQADVADNMLAWFDGNVDDPTTGFERTIEPLGSDDLAPLDPAPGVRDGEALIGVLIGRETACSLEDIDRVYSNDDQKALFPDTYESYTRTDKQGADCYADGSCDRMAWRSDVVQEQQILGTVTYAFPIASGLLGIDAVPAEADDDVALEARLSRTHMVEPAEITGMPTASFDQNYQFEVVAPHGDGVLHVYAMWTDVKADGLDTTASIFVNSYIDGLWDTLTELEAHCEEVR